MHIQCPGLWEVFILPLELERIRIRFMKCNMPGLRIEGEKDWAAAGKEEGRIYLRLQPDCTPSMLNPAEGLVI